MGDLRTNFSKKEFKCKCGCGVYKEMDPSLLDGSLSILVTVVQTTKSKLKRKNRESIVERERQISLLKVIIKFKHLQQSFKYHNSRTAAWGSIPIRI
jgi:hypothetical protein